MPTLTAIPGQLEQVTQRFIESLASRNAPPINSLSPAEARSVLERMQEKPADKPRAQLEDLTLPCGPNNEVRVRIVRPPDATGVLPVVMYFHGGGWILGSKNTHDRLVRDLANGANAAVVFVDYTPSPEAQYPVAIEEAYAATKYIAESGDRFSIDGTHLAVAGDSVGGNMAAVTAILAKQRGGPVIAHQLMFYPVTDSGMDTASYRQMSSGPWLTKAAMEWFWDAYLPDKKARTEITASPLQASVEELSGLPPALVITVENDVLRDEGEAYAHKLMAAGVDVTAVRYLGTVHDFMVLNPLAGTSAAQGAISLASQTLRAALLPKPEPREQGHI